MDAIQDQVIDKLTGKYSFARNIPDRFKEGVVKQQIQAEENFINAILRRESGAAISDAEYERAASQYFPQAGDTQEVLNQKRQNREAVLQNLVSSAGRAYQTSNDFLDLGSSQDDPLQLFSNEAQTSLKGTTDVSGIRDGSKVVTSIGSGVATGIQGGSALWDKGLDLVLSGGGAFGYGAPVPSPVTGTVVDAKSRSGWGNQVKIRLANGAEVWVSHLSAMDVKPGQKVKQGQLIGKQGNTGSVLGGDGRKLTSREIKEGRGTHLDITIKKPDGSYYTSQEVASLLGTRLA